MENKTVLYEHDETRIKFMQWLVDVLSPEEIDQVLGDATIEVVECEDAQFAGYLHCFIDAIEDVQMSNGIFIDPEDK